MKNNLRVMLQANFINGSSQITYIDIFDIGDVILTEAFINGELTKKTNELFVELCYEKAKATPQFSHLKSKKVFKDSFTIEILGWSMFE